MSALRDSETNISLIATSVFYVYNINIPTIFWLGNIRIVINTKDHGYPHVHVLAPDAKAKIRIDTLDVS